MRERSPVSTGWCWVGSSGVNALTAVSHMMDFVRGTNIGGYCKHLEFITSSPLESFSPSDFGVCLERVDFLKCESGEEMLLISRE